MPLYEYRCESCGDVFEVIQKFSEEPLAAHPGCGGHVVRLLSAPALQFKGTGWYVTDYARKNGSSASSGNGSAGEAKGGDKAESKTETKAGASSKDSGKAATTSTKDK